MKTVNWLLENICGEAFMRLWGDFTICNFANLGGAIYTFDSFMFSHGEMIELGCKVKVFIDTEGALKCDLLETKEKSRGPCMYK